MEKQFSCSNMVIDLTFCPLEKYFEPLATFCELPILAGDTLYPSMVHYIAARLFRDINKLEAAKVVPTVKSFKDLHLYIASVVVQCTNDEITSWRSDKMFNTLKVATQLKFAQYTELKALLMQTGNSFLIESNPDDLDWSIGFGLEDLEHWMKDNGVSTYDVACWIFHPEFKPGSIGSNVNGRLLMIMRHEFLAESGLDFRAHSEDAEIMPCSICISKTRDTFKRPRDYDRLMLVNGPKNYLSFNFPIHFYVDNALFENIDLYVLEKMKDLNPKTDTLIAGNLDNLKRHILSLYEIATKAAYSQNRLLRHAISLVERCFLIDVRDFGSVNDERLIELAQFLGAFGGNLDQFSDFIDLHKLSIGILDAVWSNNGIIPRLNQLGENKLGLLMIELRDEVCSGGFQTESLTDEWIDNFKSSFFTLLEKQSDIVNFDGSLLSNNFVFLNSRSGEKPNPLSRYHICSFVSSENVTYSSVEHYFWWNKMQNVAPKRFVDHLLTLDPKILKETCLNWLACNTPLCDEEDDKLPDDQLLIEATYAKLEQNPAFFNYLLQNFDLLIDCDHCQESQLKHLIERFDLNTKLLTFCWSEKCDAPPDWLCLNNYGLILMKLRQVFINQHFTDILDRNCSEIKNIELTIPESLSANTYFLFDDHDVLKFDRFTTFIDENGKPFKSVYHYSFYKCLKTLKLDQEAENLLQDITEPFECVRFTEYIVRLKSLFAEFVNYMNENDNAIMLQAFVLSDKQNDDKFAKMLRNLKGSRLIYSNINKQYGLCENKTTLIDMFNELSINPTILPVLLNNDSIKPKMLGMSLWARHLELYKDHLLLQCAGKAADFETDNDFSSQILRITAHTTKNETQDCVEKEDDKKPGNSSVISLPSWNQFQNFIQAALSDEVENIVQEDVKPVIESASNDTSKAAIKLDAVDQKLAAETTTTDSKVLLLTTAFEHCCRHAVAPENSSLPGSIYLKELLNQCRNENEAEDLGRNLAQCFEKLFGDELKCDLTSFLVNKSGLTSEDLHNIGRIVGYER